MIFVADDESITSRMMNISLINYLAVWFVTSESSCLIWWWTDPDVIWKAVSVMGDGQTYYAVGDRQILWLMVAVYVNNFMVLTIEKDDLL